MPNGFWGKGNLVDSPTLKHISIRGEDRTVTDMRVFFDEFSQNEQGEIVQKGGFFMGVTIWGKKGEDAARLLRKGARVRVDGRLEQFNYKDKDTGELTPAFQIIADDINLALSRVESITFTAKRVNPAQTPEQESA